MCLYACYWNAATILLDLWRGNTSKTRILNFYVMNSVSNILTILMGTLALISSCTQDDALITRQHTPSPNGVSHPTFQRSEAQAREIALDFLREDHSDLRSLSRKDSIETKVVLSSSKAELRALSSDAKYKIVDTLLYVLNIGKARGSLLVSGDSRLPSIMGFIPNVRLNPDSVPLGSGLSFFLSALPSYYEHAVKLLSRFEVIVYRPINRKYGPPVDCMMGIDDREYEGYTRCLNWHERIVDSDWELGKENLCPVKWDQDDPYNQKAPLIGNERALAGCVSVATAQLMATHKYPEYLGGRSLNWNLLCSYEVHKDEDPQSKADFNDNVSFLLRAVGDALSNQWGTKATSAYTQSIPWVLYSFGYKSPSRVTDFNISGIISSLRNGSPVIMDGQEYNQPGGHAWLCDGYKVRRILSRHGYRDLPFGNDVVTHSSTEYEYLLHYNWGWGGAYNGYFFAGVFATREDGARLPYNLSYRVHNILNIKP